MLLSVWMLSSNLQSSLDVLNFECCLQVEYPGEGNVGDPIELLDEEDVVYDEDGNPIVEEGYEEGQEYAEGEEGKYFTFDSFTYNHYWPNDVVNIKCLKCLL